MLSCNMLSSFCHKTYRKMINRSYFLRGLEFRKINATLLLSFLNTDISSLKNYWIQWEINWIERKITLFAPYKTLLHGNASTWTMPMFLSQKKHCRLEMHAVWPPHYLPLQASIYSIRFCSASFMHHFKAFEKKSFCTYRSARNRKTENSRLLVPYSIKANCFCELHGSYVSSHFLSSQFTEVICFYWIWYNRGVKLILAQGQKNHLRPPRGPHWIRRGPHPTKKYLF